MDEARVDGTGLISNSALEHELALRARSDVLLKRPKILHLTAVTEIDGKQLASAILAIE